MSLTEDCKETPEKGKTQSKIKKVLVKAGKAAGKKFKSAMTEKNIKHGLAETGRHLKSGAKQAKVYQKKIAKGWVTVQKTAQELQSSIGTTSDLLGFNEVSVPRKKEGKKRRYRPRSVSSIIFGEDEED